MTMIVYILCLNILVIYVALCNGMLCQEKEKLRQELHKSESDLAKLKMLNKLKQRCIRKSHQVVEKLPTYYLGRREVFESNYFM